MAFQWNINPTGTNIYVDKLGNDTTGNGTAQNPYKSIAKATSVGVNKNNIILGNGVWEEQRTLNGRNFNFYGSGKTIIKCSSTTAFSIYNTDSLHNIRFSGVGDSILRIATNQRVFFAEDCILEYVKGVPYEGFHTLNRCVLINCSGGAYVNIDMRNCILVNSNIAAINAGGIGGAGCKIINNIFIGVNPLGSSVNTDCDYNNFTTLSVTTTGGSNAHSINNASTGQTVTDYFNGYNPTSPELSDFTAKAGSKNIRAGYGNGDIGFSQGFGRSASASEFTTAGGAILKGLSLVNGQIVLSQCNLFPQVATSNSITLDSSASAVNDHFKDLYIRITSGTGVGQLRLITAYNGTTKVATISGTWDVIPDSSSTYTCSGYLESADIDLGKIVKVKRNWFYGQFGYDLTTVTGVYNQKPNATDNDYTNKTFVEFGMKFSKLNDLSSKTWSSFSPNGANLFDGTYGDGETGYTIANGQYIIFRYCKIKFNVAI